LSGLQFLLTIFMAEIKTKPGKENVEDFLNNIKEEQKRKDSIVLLDMMEKISGEKPIVWGGSMIGFGNLHVKSASGREVDWFRIGFAPRKANISLYLTCNIQRHEAALKKLGKHKTGVGCLYINKISDVDLKTLEEIIAASLNIV
jgi:hypothetical protein